MRIMRMSACLAMFPAFLAWAVAGCAGVRETPQQAAVRARVESLVADLGHNDWRRREEATARLKEMGASILPQIQLATTHRDPEVAWRAEVILRELRSRPLWTGKKSRNWHDPANWSPPYVPEDFCDVTIIFDETIKNWPVIHKTGAVVRGLFVDKGASLSLAGGAAILCSEHLTVHGIINAEDGTVQGPSQQWTNTILQGPIRTDRGTRHGPLLAFDTTAYAIIIVHPKEE